MTAPIVHVYPPRDPVAPKDLAAEIEQYANPDKPWALRIGDLWERVAESDTAAHGEPIPLERVSLRRESRIRRDPVLARMLLARDVERRRPAMRAARERNTR